MVNKVKSESSLLKALNDNSFFKRNLVAKDRKILIYDEIDENSIVEAIYYLHRLRSIDLKRGEKRPIEILINSCGGNVQDGLTLISLIESMKDEGWEITTTNMGYAYSMGFILSICGTHRYAYRYSSYLFHDASFAVAGMFEDITDEVNKVNRLRGIIKEIICKYTKLTAEDIEAVCTKRADKTFSAEKAVELGIADKIV